MPRYASLKTVHDLPKPHEYWTNFEKLEQGDESQVALFVAVGMALTEWEGLEQNMADLFAWMVESQSSAAIRAYGSAISGRSDFILGAAEIFFERNKVSEEHKAEFKILMTHKGSAAKFRNEIAHGRAIGIGFNGQPLGCFLMSPDYNSRKTELLFKNAGPESPWGFFTSKYRYTSSQISEITTKFIALRDVTLEYRALLANTYPNVAMKIAQQPPESPLPLDSPEEE